ncbi:hypothetical protein HYS03_00475 [Candidatus Woesebacteria bacterium]|nr:hypothetical protein [Candidatus Woesebacteria bacterium]QQG47635.1 MAG: hypothetical protein HY044_00935 [Candidatus Woesebacteria bacterium]
MNQLAQNVDFNTIQSQGLPGFKFSTGTVGSVTSALLPYIFAIAGIILLLFLISAGISYMTARGDPKAISGAQARITYALIGFIIILLAYWGAQAAGLILGLGQITNTFKYTPPF